MSIHNERPWYTLLEPERLPSPCMLVYRDRLIANIDRAIRVAGTPDRLRPHVKTHKSADVVGLHLARGVLRFKCATIGEAQMLARAGAADVLLAYQPVGPNIERLLLLAHSFPRVRVGCVVDSPATVDVLDLLAERHGVGLHVFIDLDVGMHRTGIAAGEAADDLYRRIAAARWLVSGGIHAYDGHSVDPDPESRRTQAAQARELALAMGRRMREAGLSVPEIVLGGTPSFPCHAEALAGLPDDERRTIRLSPGTYGYFDWGYGSTFADLPFEAAALVFGRVISVPTPGRFTIDVGSKAIAADSAAARGTLLNLPGAVAGPQSEEHWVFEVDPDQTPAIGTVLYVWPRHICPSTEHYDEVAVVTDGGQVTEWWPVTARGRAAELRGRIPDSRRVTMATPEEVLEGRGYPMADAPVPGGLYQPVVVEGGFAYLSGSVPVAGGKLTSAGSVPSEVSVEEAQKAAELCAANLLRVFARDVGPLDRIRRLVKVTGFVNADPDFTEPHVVVNGASQLFIDVLGDAGRHARSAVGMATLPVGASVEVEVIIAVDPA